MIKQNTRSLNLLNIDGIINQFQSDLQILGQSIQGKCGIPLLHSVKRDVLGHGPYPNVTFFEASNRIMSDLVILYGIEYLLRSKHFPFTEYKVEFGNENRNNFDIQALSSNESLVGEAFNVAPSFFQGKKSHALKKLKTNPIKTKYRVLMFNSDAVDNCYQPRHSDDRLHFVIVDIFSKEVFVTP